MKNLSEDFNFDTRFMLLMELEMVCFFIHNKELFIVTNKRVFRICVFLTGILAHGFYSMFPRSNILIRRLTCTETAENRKKKCTGNEFCEAKKIDQNVLTHPTPARPKITCLFPDYARAIEYL